MENRTGSNRLGDTKTAAARRANLWHGMTQSAAHVDTSADAVRKRLITLYIQASLVAVLITLFLTFCGLEFTGRQWWIMLLGVAIGVPAYVIPDVLVLRRQFEPLGRALTVIDKNEDFYGDKSACLAEGLVRALNLPFLFFLRINFLHGPLATGVVILVLGAANIFLDAGFETWQLLLFSFSILFFASPAHAVYEYFALSRIMIPVVDKLWNQVGDLDASWQSQIRSIPLKSKLFYLSIFMTAIPLAFLAWSTVYKAELLVKAQGLAVTMNEFGPIIAWAGGLVAVSISLVFVIGYLLAVDTTHGAQNLGDAMNYVRDGQLDIELRVAGTDEYADLYRGFNHMTRELRDELKIHAITHELAGVISLDTLISKIMNAASELLDAERATLFLYDEDTKELWSRFAEGLDTKEIRFPSHAGIAGNVLTTGQVANISDPYSDARFNQEIDRETGFITRSILCVPIVHKRGTRIGVAQMLNKRGGAFSATDEMRLQSFAAQISSSLENARLFEGVLEMKNYSDSILRSTTDGILTLNQQKRIVTANAAVCKIFCCTERDLIGKDAQEFFSGHNSWVLASVDRVTEDEDSDLVVDEIFLCGPNSPSVNLRTTELMDGADESLGFLLAFEDMSGEKRLKTTMSRYMSKEVADELLESGTEALRGRSQKVTVLFSDIRQFTSLSEELGARETVAMLNEYFEIMVEIVHQNGGILDKYIGDAIMALFGAPFEKLKDADNGLRTANEMMRQLKVLNRSRERRGAKPIEIGVGLCTGEVVAGNIGSPKRLDYTAVGDHVNIASRLEGATKHYGASILISEFTKQALKEDYLLREIDVIRVKGKNRPVRVFEAMDYMVSDLGNSLHAFLDRYREAHEMAKGRNWAVAIALFESALALRPDDVPSRLHLERCQAYELTPPAADWDGVWTMDSK